METGIGSVDGPKGAPSGAVACPATFPASSPTFVGSPEATLGRHLARRLVQVGVGDVFAVPGDFNLTLLDYLVAEPGLRLVGCCNELNAGYAADGENLPLICIVGGPNSNDYGTNRVLHHTIGLPDFSQELRCFTPVTCYQAVVNNLDDAHEQIDKAISTALKESKPVYISVSCNLPSVPHPTFSRDPAPYFLAPRMSNQMGLEAAVEATVAFLDKAVKPVMVAGPKLRVAKAGTAFAGLVAETLPRFIGTYWGAVSTAFCAEIVESADAYLFAGPIFNDYSSVGYSFLLKKEKAVIVQPDRVTVGNGPAFGCIMMKDFLTELGKRLKKNTTAYENYKRIWVPEGQPPESEPGEPLRVNVLFKHVQKMLTGDSAVIAETGDSWFNCQKLKLPDGCGYEFQMQYGSIGWSVGALLGYAQGATDKRVIACIGDGSFQVTAQDVSTMLRCGQNSIIFLINNGGYTIEVEIHDGPYNEELTAAIETATGDKKDCLCFIEVVAHKDDTSKELLEWGSRVSTANSRPPNPQ
uniref:pyruvate decarboxylase n=1 Tax=Aegilops tauschii subsp. strangulata TaxID=200361 RepID=A0A453AK19_AEGTS